MNIHTGGCNWEPEAKMHQDTFWGREYIVAGAMSLLGSAWFRDKYCLYVFGAEREFPYPAHYDSPAVALDAAADYFANLNDERVERQLDPVTEITVNTKGF